MKKFLTLLLTVALTATLAITGTVAYLTDTDQDVNAMTLGNVDIEQYEWERVDVTKSILENGNKKSFTQAKPLYPVVGSAAWDIDPNNATDEQKAWRSLTMNNVVDKYVTVKNTGRNNAYVRTIFALEMGSLSINELADAISASINSENGSEFPGMDWIWPAALDFVAPIDGQNYNIMVAVYNEELAPNVETIPSLLQVYMKSAATNETCEKIDGNGNGTYDIHVLSQAVQTDGFTDATTALNTGFGEVNATNVQTWFGGTDVSTPSDDDDLQDELQNPDSKTIVVNLTGDRTYDTAAWANEAMGGAGTEEVIINGNGHTLTFNNTNSDWNNIVTNGAKLVLNDVNITNSGYNDGPWNRHDINFACDVEMNNVTSDKAFAFKAGATLKNVTINDANTADTYAIWIQPNGQTVTLDGCTIDMLACTDGRGIKIDEQYVSTPGKVTLVVKNTTFKTEEKSAILVKSVAGADITLENVNIAGVSADSTNPVWVDSASAAYADLVTVTGGSKVVEP